VLWCGLEGGMGHSLYGAGVSAKPADKTEENLTRTRNSRQWTKSRNSQNKEHQTEIHQTRISQRSNQKKKSQEKPKNERQTKRASKSNSRTKSKQETCEEARVIWRVMESVMKASKERDSKITPGCVDRVGCVVMCCDTLRCTICKAWATI